MYSPDDWTSRATLVFMNGGRSPWKMVVGEVDGESVVIMLRRGVDAWAPHSVVRFDVVHQRVERITDYFHCPWILEVLPYTWRKCGATTELVDSCSGEGEKSTGLFR
jgi:hypothetical protein